MTCRSALRALLRKEVIAVCAVAFMADIVAGILNATFSLYAASLGASVVLIGLLTSLSSVTSLLTSIPVGIISDRVGRGRVLFCGMASFALALALFAIAPSPVFLIPGRLLLGLAAAIGFYSMTGGIGNALAPLALGVVADLFGLGTAFFAAGGLGAIGLAIIAGLWSRTPRAVAVSGPLEGSA